MNPTFIGLFLLVTACNAAFLYWTWSTRGSRGAPAYRASTIAAIVWSLGALLEIWLDDAHGLDLALRIQYTGSMPFAVAWFAFSLALSELAKSNVRKLILTVSVLPAAIIVIVWVPSATGLLWTPLAPAETLMGTMAAIEHGPLYWAHWGAWFFLVGGASLLTAIATIRNPLVDRVTRRVVLMALTVPLASGLIQAVEPLPVTVLPLGVALGTWLLGWSVGRKGFLNRATESSLQAINYLPTGVLVTVDDGRIVHANPMSAELIGVRVLDLLGNDVGQVLADALPGLGPDAIETLPEPGESAVYWRPDAERAVAVSRRRIPDEGETPYELFFLEDQTRRTLAEEATAQATASLEKLVQDRTRRLKQERAERERVEEGQMQLMGLLESSPDVVFLAGPNLRIQYLNRAGREVLGSDPEPDTEPPLFTEMLAPEDQEAFHTEGVERLLREEPWSRDATVIASTGESYPVDMVIVAETWAGRIQSVAAIMRDMRERLDAQSEKERLTRQLHHAQKMETIGTLAGGIAHDFNNLLSAILGFADLAKHEIAEDSSAHADLDQVIQAADRAKDLSRQILTFGRQVGRESEAVRLQDLVEEVTALLRGGLPSTIEILGDLDADCPSVWADPTQLHQVLMNLATNAAHAMRDHGGELTISLHEVATGVDEMGASDAATCARLVVRDTGCGIPSQRLDRIFEPFYSTKTAGEGTGLGLSVVHGIVLGHGGRITVDSEPDVGTVFQIFLPFAEEDSWVDHLEAEVGDWSGSERILLVDDEPQLAELGGKTLRRWGYEVTTETSSRNALTRFRADPNYDVIVTDQTMPGLTGTALTRRIRSIRPDVRVVLTTGYSETVGAENAHEFGIDAFAMKPLAGAQLAKAVRRAIDGS